MSRVALALILLTGMLVVPRTHASEDGVRLRVAVAANFRAAFEQLSRELPGDLGVVATYGSSGLLAAQILQGAPFDVFLSADRERPLQLVVEGVAPGQVRPYAVGRVALWTPGVTADPAMVKSNRYTMANPELAPYGRAARDCLESIDLWRPEDNPPVLGTNVSQAFHFVSSGAVDLGFVALSQLVTQQVSEKEMWLCPENIHSPIEQFAVRITDRDEAQRLIAFLIHPDTQLRLAGFGYRPIAP